MLDSGRAVTEALSDATPLQCRQNRSCGEWDSDLLIEKLGRLPIAPRCGEQLEPHQMKGSEARGQ